MEHDVPQKQTAAVCPCSTGLIPEDRSTLQTLTADTVYGMKLVRCSSLDENNCGVVIDTPSRVLVPGPIYMQFNSVRPYFKAA